MGLLDWLRDGFHTGRAQDRHSSGRLQRQVDIGSLHDPSGPHHFGRRAHRPDPNGHYGFAPDAYHRGKLRTAS